METISTTHPLRTIILRYDREKTAPAFETLALQYYHEIHDRTFDIKQRVQEGRKYIPNINFKIEELEDLYREACRKFDHLKVMYTTNPNKETVRGQLKTLLEAMHILMDEFVPDMIDQVNQFFGYDDYIFDQEAWMNEVAFPQFHKIFAGYQECSVDMVFFDRDLEDFKCALASVKKMEAKYMEEANQLVDTYSDLNDKIDVFFEQVAEFDETLLGL